MSSSCSVYEFGGSWVHKLQIGPITDPISGDLYPCLTGVAGKCLSEDVGEFPGYEEFLETMADPKHAEYVHFKKWYGGSFDPTAPPAD